MLTARNYAPAGDAVETSCGTRQHGGGDLGVHRPAYPTASICLGAKNVRGAALIVLPFGIYFLPIFVAYLREHRNTASIAIVNLFLGWTLTGWVVALAWAFSAGDKGRPNFQ